MKPNPILPGVIILFIYEAILVLGGVLAFVQAPAEANKATALIVPLACAGVLATCAATALVMSQKPRADGRRRGRGALWAGAILSLVIAAALGQRAMATSKAIEKFKESSPRYEAAAIAEPVLKDPDARKKWFKAAGAADHDKSYLLYVLAGLGAAGLITGLAVGAIAARAGSRGD